MPFSNGRGGNGRANILGVASELCVFYSSVREKGKWDRVHFPTSKRKQKTRSEDGIIFNILSSLFAFLSNYFTGNLAG